MSKGLTDRENPANGVFQALELAAHQLGVTVDNLLANTVNFIHGTTSGTNILLERKGAKVGLITTRGFEDTILIGRMGLKNAGLSEKEIVHYSKLRNPDPIVPHEYICGVSERIDADGDCLMNINMKEAEQAVESLVSRGVDAIAVCLLWSFLNPAHENAIKNLISSRNPNIYITLSHEISPTMGEYERTVTTVLNCYIAPTLVKYMKKLEETLRKKGYKNPLLIIKGDGGLSGIEEILQKPILTLDSGPAAGVIGSQFLGNLLGEENVISTDVGGTSFDVGLVERGKLENESSPVIMHYTYKMPKLLVQSVGAGGGSIARVEHGLLRVGPESAGSNPGPACYDRGGEKPTLTDADVMLGYLDPDYFWGGNMKLNKKKAGQAIKRLADELHMDEIEVAAGINKILCSDMAELIRKCSLQKGHDTRQAIILSFGGAGPVHACQYCQEVGSKYLVVPGNASVFSAAAMLRTPVKHSIDVSLPTALPLTEKSAAAINELFVRAAQEVITRFENEGINKTKVNFKSYAFARYPIQVQDRMMEIPMVLKAENTGMLMQKFNAEYEEQFGEHTALEGEYPALSDKKGSANPGAALKGQRQAYFSNNGKSGFMQCNVYDDSKLKNGMSLSGPCLVERMGDTVVVTPQFDAVVDEYHNILIKRK
jgi:N-methylhydantoinase A